MNALVRKRPEKDLDQMLDHTFPASDPPALSGNKTREERKERDAAERDSRLKPRETGSP